MRPAVSIHVILARFTLAAFARDFNRCLPPDDGNRSSDEGKAQMTHHHIVSDDELAAMPISLYDLQRYITATATGRCLICRQEDWSAFGTGDDAIAMPFIVLPRVAPPDARPTGEYYPVIVLHCHTCANVRLLSRTILNRWVIENPV
jgi:hypothetical protein